MSPYRYNRSMSFTSDDDDAMDETSVPSSPPRTSRKAVPITNNPAFDVSKRHLRYAKEPSQCSSPQNRRLFDDADVESPPRPSSRGRTLKSIDLNQDVGRKNSFYRHSSIDSDITVNSNESGRMSLCSGMNGRKRSSSDRRTEQVLTMTPRRTYSDSIGESPNNITYSSPHMAISPNSYITMDGRFVQSNNPFSSPVVTTSSRSDVDMFASAATGPTLPTSFYGSSSVSRLPGLPPRHSPATRSFLHQTPRVASCPVPYTQRTTKFTFSPIAEEHGMETDTASTGSLNKVRRLSETDDVVAATGQHLRNRLCIDSSAKVQYDGLINFDNEKVSPTDVLSFPTPPTPMKEKPTKAMPYSIEHTDFYSHHTETYNNPETPFLQRRRNRAPYKDDSMSPQNMKSRFTSDFDVIDQLGKGSFGTVYKVLSRLDGCMYAIKAAHRKAKGIADRQRMFNEVYALAALSDQADAATIHIVRYHQGWMEDDRLYIQTELCSGTLADEMINALTLDRRYKLLRELCLALAFIHKNDMVHLDIKPENIFIKNDQYKLGDFGLVTKATCDQDVEEGDSRYMSMELLSGDKADLTKSDIFSLGATLYEISIGRPLPMNGEEWQNLRSGVVDCSSIDTDLAKLIKEMMQPKASSRPTASILLLRPKLLSDEQKALHAEKTKVLQANFELAAQAQRFKGLSPPPRKGLTRANTWTGSLPY